MISAPIPSAIKSALIVGLMAGGAKVRDIGLAITPMAYFAQFALDVPAVAMVTASHNDNGWTGVEDGRGAAGDLRAGRDGAPARHRARRRLEAPRGRTRTSSSPTFPPATSPI